jgi:RNA polymerase sigma-70 factor (ECF subfamily)
MTMETDLPFSGEWPPTETPPGVSFQLDRALEDQWIRAAKEGCHLAFGRLLETHQDRIYSLCLRLLGSPEDAAEACQDVFVKAYHALPDFRPEARFSTWLYRIAVNRSHDFWKRASTKLKDLTSHLSGKEVDLTSPQAGPDHRIGWQDSLRELDLALQELPPKDREILVLAGIENLTHQECADILGTSTRGVEGRLYRAREKLRKVWPGPLPKF